MPKTKIRSLKIKAAAELARNLAQLRKNSRLSQSEVARRMGTSQTAIARLERGRQNPTMSTLQDFASANGFCLEIGFVRTLGDRTGVILVVEE
jgi:transcriptional regulator with XRE-family HTH domain